MSDFDGIHRTEDGIEFNYIIDSNTGEKRVLSCLPSPDDHEGLPHFSSAEGAAIVPKSEWQVVDNSWLNVPILNQNGHNSCAGNATCGAVMRCRAMRGAAFQLLSASYTYAYNNGGRDSGANISGCVKTAMERGVCLDSEFPESMVYQRQIPSSANETAKRFRVESAVHLSSFDEMVSAIQLDWIVVAALYVARDFGQLDSDGVAPVHRGIPNHALHFDGFYFGANGRPILAGVNSWSIQFGRKGRFGAVEEYFNNSSYFDANAIKGTLTDLSDVDIPPVLV